MNDDPIRVQIVQPPIRSTVATKVISAATWLAVGALVVEIVTYPGRGRRDTPKAD